jgi:DNA recombination-dependent growth factor C
VIIPLNTTKDKYIPKISKKGAIEKFSTILCNMTLLDKNNVKLLLNQGKEIHNMAVVNEERIQQILVRQIEMLSEILEAKYSAFQNGDKEAQPEYTASIIAMTAKTLKEYL